MSLKKLLALAMVGVLSLSLVACGEKNQGTDSASVTAEIVEVNEEGKALLEKAKAANENIESFESKNTLEFSFKNANGEGSASSVTIIKDKMKSPIEKAYITETKGNGQELVKSEVYVKETNGQKELFIGENDQWYKSDVDDELLFYTVGHYNMKMVVGKLLEKVDGLRFDGEEEINGVKTSKATGTISAKSISSAAMETGIFVATGMTALTEEHLKGAPAMNISFWIDNETGHVVKVEFDAAGIYQTISDNVFKLIKDTEEYKDAESLKINKYKYTYEISDINSLEAIEFPKELENAYDLDEMAKEAEANEKNKEVENNK